MIAMKPNMSTLEPPKLTPEKIQNGTEGHGSCEAGTVAVLAANRTTSISREGLLAFLPPKPRMCSDNSNQQQQQQATLTSGTRDQ
mmetsp:Transcript_18468/g.29378  ORF Transcript_18468/g.29378 Transcript_18468/m.29378 type:complete len:85 (+) Transcript_18468:25-279(+)